MKLSADTSFIQRIARVGLLSTLFLIVSIGGAYAFNEYVVPIIQQQDGDVTYGAVGGVQTLNPYFVRRGTNEEALSKALFRGLITYDEEGAVVGDLAESWEFRDSAKEVLVKLRTDIYWSDNVKVTANDVIFSYQLAQQEIYDGPYADSFTDVEIEAVSDNTVLFTLPNTYVPFLDTLQTPILPLHLFGSNDVALVEQQSFLRNGPFSSSVSEISTKIVEENGSVLVQNIELTNANGTVHVQFYENIQALQTAYAIGDIDVVVATHSDTVTALADLSQTEAHTMPVVGQQTILFINTKSVSDINKRKAILHAVDNEIISGDAFVGPYPRQSQFWKRLEGHRISTDQDLAKEQLDGNTFSIVTFDTDELIEAAEKIKGDLEVSGAKVKLYVNTPIEFNENAAPERQYDMVLLPLEIGQEPDVYSFWHSSQASHPGLNFSQLVSRRVDNALEQGRANVSLDTRMELYTEFQRNLLDEHAVEFFGHPEVFLLSYTNDLTVYPEYVWNFVDFWRFALDS